MHQSFIGYIREIGVHGRVIYTSCTLDCPDGCGIKAHVQNGRVIKLEGWLSDEFTRGYLRQDLQIS
jgi:anaerobic selenocysteine-containing dehydrogenase